ncbi:MAG: cytochrome c biogenesis protein ResB [Deltaproteobacteria bacterium]|nr:cytochrome c biogenesis protein ResB [Deltaproteobacteria bacterium]
MKRLWTLLVSLKLTIVFTVVICALAVWGSLLTVRHPQLYGQMDEAVLLPFLAQEGARMSVHAFWIIALIVIMAGFAMHLVFCTADKVYSILKNSLPWRSFLPHVVHIGFLAALLGHLVGSVWGFRSQGNIIMQGQAYPVPNAKGLYMRLDDVEVKTSGKGNMEYLRSRVTLLDEGKEIVTKDIEINNPLIYKGIAFYHVDHGAATTGLVLDVDGARVDATLGGVFKTPDKATLALGAVFPDFDVDSGGQAYSRSNEYRNTHVEIMSSDGGVAYLALSRPGAEARLGKRRIRLVDYISSRFAVYTINKDPGIWLIIIGSTLLVGGSATLLFARGEKNELVSREQSGN